MLCYLALILMITSILLVDNFLKFYIYTGNLYRIWQSMVVVFALFLVKKCPVVKMNKTLRNLRCLVIL